MAHEQARLFKPQLDVELEEFRSNAIQAPSLVGGDNESRIGLLTRSKPVKEEGSATGSKFSLIAYIVVALVVLSLNVGWSVWAATRYKNTDEHVRLPA